ncbi:MAG: 50S ribosomal protein L13 [Chloroflexi bacterium]|nr:50S ribosomal protein L13 [Chloroflexota bacterium]
MSLHKTYATKPGDIKREWWIVDAEGQTLGRLATQIAHILRGKHKPYFTPSMDTGDYVIVINCGKIGTTGNRLDDKHYYHHSGYVGGLKTVTLRDQLQRFPDRPLREAVKGMLPKNALGHQMIKKLRLYKGTEHPHAGQNPRPLRELFGE